MNNTSAKFSDWEYRNIALAVAVQCAQLVHILAHTGRADPVQVKACVETLLVLNPDSVADVYPKVNYFASGLNALQKSLSGEGLKEYADAMKYVLGMSVLQQQLSAASEMQETIRRRLALRHSLYLDEEQSYEREEPLGAPQKSEDFDYAQFAALYQETISKLSYRVHVKGSPEHLRKQRVADQIRALLLAGIRSAMLWQQLGGRRWHLFFYKKRIRDCVAHIRRNLFALH